MADRPSAGMRAISIFLVMVLQSWQPLVSVGKTISELVSSDQALRERCGGAGEFEACTRLVAYRLDASCTERNDGWMIRSSARFTPYLLVRGTQRLAHERAHVLDIESQVQRYLVALDSERFGSAEACRGRALAESTRFGETLGDFARDSNRRLH